MRTLLYLIVLVTTLAGCQKKDADPGIIEQEIVFNINEIFPAPGLKAAQEFECRDLSLDYAKIQIGDNYYFAPVHILNGTLCTQPIRLEVPAGGTATYTVNEFFLMHDFGVKGVYPDLNDSIVRATPTETGIYKVYVSKPLSMSFDVNGLTKSEIPVDVLCFNLGAFVNFGYLMFQITDIVVRTKCFFGDICLTGVPPDQNVLEDYQGSLYDAEQLPPGLQLDMPAIFKIRTFKTYKDVTAELPGSPVTNATEEYGYGSGYKLCADYPDQRTLKGETFTFELWVLVKTTSPGIFDYQHYATFTCIDGGNIPEAGPENILEFSIGNCSLNSNNVYDFLPAPPPPPPIK